MTALLDKAFRSMSNLNMWLALRSGDQLTLANVNEIIPLRWAFFRDNWEFIRQAIIDSIADSDDSDTLVKQIDSFQKFIERQRNAVNKEVNPFRRSNILTEYYAIWESLSVSSLPISRQEQEIIDNKTSTIERYIATDFRNIRNDMVAARDELADTIGLSDPSYNASKKRSSVFKLRDPKISDIIAMQSLHVGISGVDSILANTNSLNTVTVDPFALARTNADNPDVIIGDGRSGFLAKMNFGDSLQDLAYRFLGDPERWIDIAIANGLKPPYIDEIGEAIPLISNGDGNQVNIARLDPSGSQNIDKFYVGQPVFLKSNTTTAIDQRSITSIKEVPVSGEIVLELSGALNLDQYKLIDNAYVRVYKPGTINSNFLILIPSEVATEAAPNDEPYFVKTLASDEKKAGVDLAVNDDMDIIFNSTGDIQLSFGTLNAIQAIKYKILTERGQVPRHPSYGLPPIAGKLSNDTVATKDAIVSAINDMISSDDRFSRVEQLDVAQQSNIVSIRLVVRMAGSGSLLPVTFSVNVG